MPIDNEKIAALRIKRGMTQQQAADAVGFETRQGWSNIERGIIEDPRLSTVERVAKVLGVKVQAILK
jgi:transcriptional regulator with XRE-family HTH domain